MSDLTYGAIQGRDGTNEFFIFEYPSNGAIRAHDVVQLTTSGAVQVSAANATEHLGFAISGSDKSGQMVKIADGNTAMLVMRVAGDPTAVIKGKSYGLTGTTGAQRFNQADTTNGSLIARRVDIADSLAQVQIATSAQQFGGKDLTAVATS